MAATTLPNAEQLSGSWNQIRGKIKEKWGQLSENDLDRFKGNIDQLVGHVQQKTGQSRQDVEAFLSEITGHASGLLEKARETANDLVGRAGEAVHQQYETAAETFSHGYSDAQDMVRQKPAESIVVAFGAGVVCGVLLSLMTRSR